MYNSLCRWKVKEWWCADACEWKVKEWSLRGCFWVKSERVMVSWMLVSESKDTWSDGCADDSEWKPYPQYSLLHAGSQGTTSSLRYVYMYRHHEEIHVCMAFYTNYVAASLQLPGWKHLTFVFRNNVVCLCVRHHDNASAQYLLRCIGQTWVSSKPEISLFQNIQNEKIPSN